MKFILFCVTLNLSDNLTETPNVKNSSVQYCIIGHDKFVLWSQMRDCEDSKQEKNHQTLCTITTLEDVSPNVTCTVWFGV